MKPQAMSALNETYASHIEGLTRRYARALEAHGFASGLWYSGFAPFFFQDDQNYPFKVNAPFKSWAPVVDVPESFVYFEPGKRPVMVYHQPVDYWYKAPSAPEGSWTSHFELRMAPDRSAARALLPRDLSRTAFIGEAFPELVQWGVPAVNPEPLTIELDYGRAVKTPYEIACMREASRISTLGHRAARSAFEQGASELQIEEAFLKACGLREHELAYNPIIALNESAAVLHYQMLERRAPAHRHSLLIDAATEFGGYAADITRTYANGDEEFAQLIERMDELQQSLCASVRAGVDWKDIHLSAHRLIAELLHESDLIRCEADEALESGLSSVFFPHGIGHLLGLQVHDVGGRLASPKGGEIPRPEGHPYLRLTRVLEEGFTVTMEPGLYFIDQLLNEARGQPRGAQINWARVGQFHKFGGIRIEDNLAVTATGCENLTRDAFQST